MTRPTFDECTAPIMPSVEELPYHGPNSDGVRRFLLEGGDLAPDWDKSRGNQEAWCELSVHADGFVGAYGGTVWPSAWPDLFVTTPPSTASGSGTTRLTSLGYKFLGLHVTVTPCEPSPDRPALGDRAELLKRLGLTDREWSAQGGASEMELQP